MSELMDIQVGDVLFAPAGRRSRQRFVTVTRVGRQYLYATENPGNQYHSEEKIARRTGQQATWPFDEFYRSESEHAAYKEHYKRARTVEEMIRGACHKFPAPVVTKLWNILYEHDRKRLQAIFDELHPSARDKKG